MHVVWKLGQATVRDVYEELLRRRKVAYTSVMTMMKILEQKGRLSNDRAERAHVYRPTEPRGKVLRRHGAGIRGSCISRLDQAAAAAPGGGPAAVARGSGRDSPPAKEIKMTGLWLANLWAYSLQVAILTALAALLARLVRLRSPGAVLGYWQVVLAACLLLPLLEPWRPFPAAVPAGFSIRVASGAAFRGPRT